VRLLAQSQDFSQTENHQSDFTSGFAPPYLAYYDYPAPENVGRAHGLIEESLETDGPFEGILGFSQGAGLAVSYLLFCTPCNPVASVALRASAALKTPASF
jgi:hypothetical protein